MRTTLLLATALLVSAPAQAAKLVAVLPLDVSHADGKLNANAQAALEEMLRDVATDALTAGGWTILSTQNQLQLLLDNGVDPTKCGEQNCQLATAREIKADKFISGAVQYGDGELTASIRLIDTVTGRILASERLAGKTARELRVSFEGRATEFFRKAGLVGAAADTGRSIAPPPDPRPGRPQPRKGQVVETVSLSVSARPKELVRLELVDPDGQKEVSGSPYENRAAKAGTWKITASAEGYESQTQDAEVIDDMNLVKFELLRLGGLNVEGTPAGAKVVVTGPGGFRDEGGLPSEWPGLRSGAYTVKTSRTGFGEDEQTVVVRPGDTTVVSVKLEKGGGLSGMIRIPGGTFRMGSTDGDEDERPVHSVTLSPFLIDRTEVTVASYAACVRAGKCTEAWTTVEWPDIKDDDRALSSHCNTGKAGKENHPINCVTWTQARAYCEAQGARLPTEAEWEFAARGSDGRRYPWGDQAPTAELVLWNVGGGSGPVATHPAGASPWGLQDMAGNVLEWISDAYATYPGGAVTDPQQVSGEKKVLRGGGWSSNSEQKVRTTFRNWYGPEVRTHVIGFRCARNAP